MTAGTPEFTVVAGQPNCLGERERADGQPTAEDLAALTAAVVAVLTARAAAARFADGAAANRRQGGGWTDQARLLRLPLAPGPGAWRRSARP